MTAPADPRLAEVLAGLSGVAPDFLLRQRWFGGKSREVRGLRPVDAAALGPGGPYLALVEVSYADGEPDTYLIPLALRGDPVGDDLAAFRLNGGLAALDATEDESFPPLLYRLIEEGARVPGQAGEFRFCHTRALAEVARERSPAPASLVRRAQGQSNSSITYGDAFILKLFRRLEAGTNPDLEVLRALTEGSDFSAIPRLAGWIEYCPASGGPAVSVGALQTFVTNRGGAFEEAVARLESFYRAAIGSDLYPERREVERAAADSLQDAASLGRVTGAMHGALASLLDDPDFAPEPVSTADAHAWRDTLLAEIDETRELLGRPPAGLPPSAREAIERLLAAGERLRDTAAGIAELAGSGAVKIRQHGDYHLGQLLVSEDGFIILDFEGEPSRSLAERRAKHTPLKDVAGMLRSLSYAAAAGLFAAAGGSHQLEARLEPWADLWLDLARERFLGAYASELARAPRGLLPTSRDATERALAALELEKALYELRYELNNRPDWLRVPLRGIERTLVGL